MVNPPGQRIAVVGAGIAGLSAAWLLSRQHRVTLFEANDYLGGHTHTVDVTLDGVTAPVDTGFLVFNDRTYPNLIALFAELGIASAASDMSFSVRLESEGVEWAGSDLDAVFAQRRNLLRPAFWGMLADILRFNREATASARGGPHGGAQTLGVFLEAGRYGAAFRDWYLLPMAGAIWSCPANAMLDYPAQTFFRFCDNHGLLQVSNRPQWRTVLGGARSYVARLAAAIPDVRAATPVAAIRREAGGAVLVTGDGSERFDAVVLACHSDQALRLLTDADAAEHEVLAAIPYQDNEVVLHTDTDFLPRRRKAWSAWNYHASALTDADRPVGVSYLINKLQPLPFSQPVIVTLNAAEAPRAACVIDRYRYAHPVFGAGSNAAQSRLPQLQGKRNTWFCGAWTGYGFHEDGLKSGLAVAEGFGITAPWRCQQTLKAAA